MDNNRPVKAVECTCLKEKLGSVDNILEESYSQRPEIILIEFIIKDLLKCHMVGKKVGFTKVFHCREVL